MNKATKLLMSLVVTLLIASTTWAQAPTDAPTAPTRDSADVISLFSDAFTDVSVDTWRTDWSNATFADTTIAGNPVKRYTALGFVGIETVASQIDASGMTHFHFDMWTPDATTFRAKLVDFGPTGGFSGENGDGLGDDTEHEVSSDDITTGEWVSVSIPLSDFTNLTNTTNIAQLIFSGEPFGAFSVFIDNVYFYAETAPEPVSVTFNVNTATMPDTLMPSHTIQIRGGTVGPDAAGTGLGSMITWDSQSMVATNVGGDYWTLTFDMSPGDTLNYKWWAGTDVNNGLANGGETGWESGDNNQFILAGDATGSITTDLQWYETRMKPFESKTDTVAVWFRVNVGAQIQDGSFDPDSGGVEVRGTPAPLTWDASTAAKLTSEGQVGKNHFYSGVVYFDRAELTASAPDSRPPGTIKYKFYMDKLSGDGWEGGNDKFMTVASLMDTTNHWSYFNGDRPTEATIVSTTLNFEVNVGILEGIGFFNSAVDTVYARGDFNGWSTDNQMTFNDISGNYDALNIPFTGAEGKVVPYKYYLKWDSRRDSSESELYLEGIEANNSGWEEPGSTAGGNRELIIENLDNQPVRSEFYNDVAPQALITPANTEGGGQLVATFSIDMSPAASRDDGTTPFNAAKDSVFLIVDTPFFALTNGIVAGDGNFATRTLEQRDKVMFTDDDNDMVYTLDLTLSTLTLNNIGFRIAYGEPTSETGELIINGEGFDAGRRYYQFIEPIITADGDDVDELPDVSWPATYAFPTLTWSPRDLAFETPPDYTVINTSSEIEGDNAERFVLNQNYPNPFNPSTNISFNLPTSANIKLTIYNVLGQEVATLINGKAMTSGIHTVAFDASALSSGMYIYRLEAGSFTSTKRMMLIK